MADTSGGWLQALVVVGSLIALVLGFATLVGRWIDSQVQTAIRPPRSKRPVKRIERVPDESGHGLPSSSADSDQNTALRSGR